MSGYKCKQCDAPASVDDAGVHRTCECNTTVVADMSATARGHGGAAERESIFAKLHRLGREFMSARVP